MHFFFQAEDGIRDGHVTGVQTCALPIFQYFINQKEGEEKTIAEKHLQYLIDYLEYNECRRKPLLNYFGEEYHQEECGMCDNCLKYKDNEQDYTEQAQKFLSCLAGRGERIVEWNSAH